MKKKYIILYVLLFSQISLLSQNQTKLGLRAGTNPSLLKYYIDLNAEVSRQIIFDHQINEENLNDFRSGLELFKEQDIITIICLRFPADSSDEFNNDRIPLFNSTDLEQSLTKVENLLLELNGVLDYIQIQNEPLMGPGRYFNYEENLHYGYYGLKWLDTLGKHIKETIQTNQLDIGIISPAFHNVELALSDDDRINPIPFIRVPGDTVLRNELTVDILSRYWYKNLMENSKEIVDIVDIHLNVKNLVEFKNYITALDSLQKITHPQDKLLPLSSLEWSQANEKDSLISNTTWMKNFLSDTYTNPVDTNDWYAFMDSLNYDETFMQTAFNLMAEYEFVHACYAGLHQYGTDLSQQIFSTCALLTNKTCLTTSPNKPFYYLYKNLVTDDTTTSVFNDRNQTTIFELSQNYPNPFNPSTEINYSISEAGVVSIKIYNMLGEIVTVLINEYHYPGKYKVLFDADNLSSGIYFYQLTQGEVSKTRKMLFLR